MLLKAPVLGPVLRKVVVARFTRTMGTLLTSGVPILDAMEIVAKTAGNTVVQAGIMYAREQISEGKNMATPLMETGLMPPMVVQMIGVGEQTGALDKMLSKIADFYEEEVDVAVAAMTSLIEPIMMVFLGARDRRHGRRDVPADLRDGRQHQGRVRRGARVHDPMNAPAAVSRSPPSCRRSRATRRPASRRRCRTRTGRHAAHAEVPDGRSAWRWRRCCWARSSAPRWAAAASRA